jgi:hypothetical protein
MVLFSGNSASTMRRAETAFDSGTDGPVLLPVRTELRKLLDQPLAPSDQEGDGGKFLFSVRGTALREVHSFHKMLPVHCHC